MSASNWLSVISAGTGLLAKVVPVTAPVAGTVSVVTGVAATVVRKSGN